MTIQTIQNQVTTTLEEIYSKPNPETTTSSSVLSTNQNTEIDFSKTAKKIAQFHYSVRGKSEPRYLTSYHEYSVNNAPKMTMNYLSGKKVTIINTGVLIGRGLSKDAYYGLKIKGGIIEKIAILKLNDSKVESNDLENESKKTRKIQSKYVNHVEFYKVRDKKSQKTNYFASILTQISTSFQNIITFFFKTSKSEKTGKDQRLYSEFLDQTVESFLKKLNDENSESKEKHIEDLSNILITAFKGLDAIHKKRITHNDLHNKNVMIRETKEHTLEAVIIDFDIDQPFDQGFDPVMTDISNMLDLTKSICESYSKMIKRKISSNPDTHIDFDKTKEGIFFSHLSEITYNTITKNGSLQNIQPAIDAVTAALKNYKTH